MSDVNATPKMNNKNGGQPTDDVDNIEDDETEVTGEELPPLDMTTATPEEVLKVFKAMGDEDGIIIKKENFSTLPLYVEELTKNMVLSSFFYNKFTFFLIILNKLNINFTFVMLSNYFYNLMLKKQIYV